MDHIEQNNLEQIERMNQRGGRSLSVVDLLEAGTVSAEMAALAWMLVEGGASFLTGAVPGGAGKTTLMAALLGFLPAGERIVTAAEADVVARAADGRIPPPFCLLAHEIGQGPWYAYIWGPVAQRFFSVRGPGRRRVTCLHADTPRQAGVILDACGVAPQDAGSVDVQAFIYALGGFHPARRVTALHCRLGEGPVEVYRWRPADDVHERLIERNALAEAQARARGVPPGAILRRWDECAEALERMLRSGARRFEDVRRAVLASPPAT